MDKAALVKSDLEIEGLVLEALSRAKIPVTLCVWHYAPQLEEWQLIIATPWHDSKSPRTAYSSVINALSDAGIYPDVPMRRIFVLGPKDTFIKALEREVKTSTEGAIHIVESRPNRSYSVVFSPFIGPGGAVPAHKLAGLNELREFLDKRLHIPRASVDQALADLKRKRNASILGVQLTNREARKNRLA